MAAVEAMLIIRPHFRSIIPGKHPLDGSIGAGEIDLDHLVPECVRMPADRALGGDSGCVGQHVDLSKAINGRLKEFLDRIVRGDVQIHRQALDAFGLDQRAGMVHLLLTGHVDDFALRLACRRPAVNRWRRSAPAEANATAIAKPMPEAPPVTMAVLPARN